MNTLEKMIAQIEHKNKCVTLARAMAATKDKTKKQILWNNFKKAA